MRSESLKQLLPALIKAQAEMDNPKKGKVNPAFKSGYVDLTTLMECIKAPLAENGLVLVHLLSGGHVDVHGAVFSDCLATTLHHVSGEYLTSVHPLKPVKNDPQGLGSAITYARRYSIMALLGLGAEDDDGNAASGRAPDNTAEKMRQRGSGFSRKPAGES